MGSQIVSGLNMIQIAAAAVHLGVLLGIQRLLNQFVKYLRVDRLSLVNDRSTKSAVIRAILTKLDLWIWGCGLYTLLAWHFGGNLSSLFGQNWASPARQVTMVQAFSILALSSLGARLIYVSNRRLRALAAGDASHWESVIAVLGADLLQIGIRLIALTFVLGQSGLPPFITHSWRDIATA
jgi:hypothetical protein